MIAEGDGGRHHNLCSLAGFGVKEEPPENTGTEEDGRPAVLLLGCKCPGISLESLRLHRVLSILSEKSNGSLKGKSWTVCCIFGGRPEECHQDEHLIVIAKAMLYAAEFAAS